MCDLIESRRVYWFNLVEPGSAQGYNVRIGGMIGCLLQFDLTNQFLPYIDNTEVWLGSVKYQFWSGWFDLTRGCIPRSTNMTEGRSTHSAIPFGR